jgi:ATP-dependent protease Clp ATPase subunit
VQKNTRRPKIDPLARALLDLGKVIHDASTPSYPPIGMEPDNHLPDIEKRIAALKAMTAAKPLLIYHCKKADDMEIKVLAVALYLGLMHDGYPTVIRLSELIGRGSPEAVLLSRSAIRKLCENRVLIFKSGSDKMWNGFILPSPELITMIGLSGRDSSLFTERSLASKERLDGGTEPPITAEVSPDYIPPSFAFALSSLIRTRVKGRYLDEPIRTISALYATHLVRAKMIRNGAHPGTPNVVGLLVGSSSSGKTFLSEVAAQCVNELFGGGNVLPFSSTSCADLTADGYVGLSVEDTVKPLIEKCNGDTAKARWGCCFIDEFCKKAVHGSREMLDVGGRSVQEGLLRLLGGTVMTVGGRRSGFEKSYSFDSNGTMFLLAGAFVGLDELVNKKKGLKRIGYGTGTAQRVEPRLRDCLVAYGLLPELVGRIGSVILVPDPHLEDLVEICISPGGLLSCYRNLWAGMGMVVDIEVGGIKAIAAYGLESGGFARACQSVFNRITEHLVVEEKNGKVTLGEKNVAQVVSSMGLTG